MLTCNEINQIPDRLWDWIWRRRNVNPCLFVLCGIIFVACILGLYVINDRFDFHDKVQKHLWQVFLWLSLVLDIFIFWVLAVNRRAHFRLVSAYEEI